MLMANDEKRKLITRKPTKNRNISENNSGYRDWVKNNEKKVREFQEYKLLYDSHTYRQFCLKLRMDTEANYLYFLDNCEESPKELFTRLIREDMSKNQQ